MSEDGARDSGTRSQRRPTAEKAAGRRESGLILNNAEGKELMCANRNDCE